MGNRECTNTGTNKAGNEYRAYSDGSYGYKNYNSAGEASGRYYNTGSGHEFYNPSATSRSDGQQAWHGNQNTGTRTYTPPERSAHYKLPETNDKRRQRHPKHLQTATKFVVTL